MIAWLRSLFGRKHKTLKGFNLICPGIAKFSRKPEIIEMVRTLIFNANGRNSARTRLLMHIMGTASRPIFPAIGTISHENGHLFIYASNDKGWVEVSGF